MKDANIVVDIALTIEDSEIVLIRRAKPPFMDKLCLPGGHVESSDADYAHAAVRELGEEVGVGLKVETLRLFTKLDRPNRDPRGHKHSYVYVVNVNSESELNGLSAKSDAKEIVIRSIDSLSPEDMGFDHWEVIKLLKEKGGKS